MSTLNHKSTAKGLADLAASVSNLTPMSESPLEIVKNALARAGKTAYWLAKEAGVSQGHMTNLMNGKRRFTDDVLDQIARALPIDVEAAKTAALADRVGAEGVSRIASLNEDTRPTERNNGARLRQLHEIPILNNSLGIMSDDGSVIPITNGSASGNHGTSELRPAEFILLPLYGPAACGAPLSWSYDDTEERYPVPRRAIEHTHASAVFKVSGDSMEAERIRDGDFVMVRPFNGDEPKHGHIVIVEAEGGYVCKMYRKSLLGPYLESRYAGREPEVWKPAGEAHLVGLVVGFTSMDLYGERH